MVYAQAPALTGEEIEALLAEARVARFCSLNEDGSIHAAPVWYKYEGGRIALGTPRASRKAGNVRRNGNVTVLVDVEGPPSKGVLIRGRAEVSEYKFLEAVSLFERYMSREEAERLARGLPGISEWVKITVEPERVASFDYAKDEAYRAALQG